MIATPDQLHSVTLWEPVEWKLWNFLRTQASKIIYIVEVGGRGKWIEIIKLIFYIH